MRARSVLFDFDGTLVQTNSFPRWIRFLLLASLGRGRPRLFLRIARLILRRKFFGTLTHAEFKAHLVRLDYPSSWDERFLDRVLTAVNPAVLERLEQHLAGGDAVLVSSAAPLRYLERLPTRLPPGDLRIVGATIVDGALRDNYRELKAANLRSLGVLRPGELLDLVYTDSSDDIFCARLAARTILVAPSPGSLDDYMRDPDLRDKVLLLDALDR